MTKASVFKFCIALFVIVAKEISDAMLDLFAECTVIPDFRMNVDKPEEPIPYTIRQDSQYEPCELRISQAGGHTQASGGPGRPREDLLDTPWETLWTAQSGSFIDSACRRAFWLQQPQPMNVRYGFQPLGRLRPCRSRAPTSGSQIRRRHEPHTLSTGPA